ncbi:MAG: protein kinase [Candidatus Sumerlaeota bacterium]|nr:protein kinase [Candidatus Sumerlaeota bacterium]
MPSIEPGKTPSAGAGSHPGSGASAGDFMTPDGELILPCRLGHYRVVRKLGKGGMGNVYLAEEQSLNRQVAIKTLAQRLARDPSYVRRFINEAQSIAQLVHPNIISVFYIGRVQNLVYFAMEYVEGETLADRLAREKRLRLPSVLEVGRQVCEALQCAFESGIIHRDIKPANLFIDKKGKIKVGDFGLAKSQESDLSLTQAGSVVGSPYYMSPEQGCGKKADHRSDIYSLGATLYHLTAGQPPFTADTAVQMVMRHVQDPIEPIQALPPDQREVFHVLIAKMMAKAPETRFQTYPECLQALDFLQKVLSGKAIAAPGGMPAATMIVPAQAQPLVGTAPSDASDQSDASDLPPAGAVGSAATSAVSATPLPAVPLATDTPGVLPMSITPAPSAVFVAKPAGAAWMIFAIVLLVALTVIVTAIAINYRNREAAKKDRPSRPPEYTNPAKPSGKIPGRPGGVPGGRAPGTEELAVLPNAMATSATMIAHGPRRDRPSPFEAVSTGAARPEPDLPPKPIDIAVGPGLRPAPGAGSLAQEGVRKDRPIKNAVFQQLWDNMGEDLRGYFFSHALITLQGLVDKSKEPLKMATALQQHEHLLKNLSDLKYSVTQTINDNATQMPAVEVAAGRKIQPFQASPTILSYMEWKAGGKPQQQKSEWGKVLTPFEFLLLAHAILPNTPECNRQIKVFAQIYNLEPEYLVIEQTRPIESKPAAPEPKP